MRAASAVGQGLFGGHARLRSFGVQASERGWGTTLVAGVGTHARRWGVRRVDQVSGCAARFFPRVHDCALARDRPGAGPRDGAIGERLRVARVLRERRVERCQLRLLNAPAAISARI